MELADHQISRWGLLLQALRDSVTREGMDMPARLSRARYRAWHRGTREADYMLGSFFDHHHHKWREDQLTWFEELLDEDDTDVLGWALRAQPVPDRLAGPQMSALQRLDYVKV